MSTVDKKTLASLLLGIGAFAAYAAKNKKGSASFFPVSKNMSPEDAFAAWSQRRAGLAPWEDAADASLARNAFIAKYSSGGAAAYDAARFGPASENQRIWDDWLTTSGVQNYQTMGMDIPAKFTGEEVDTSSIMGGSFKAGVEPLDVAGRFEGASSSNPFTAIDLPKFK